VFNVAVSLYSFDINSKIKILGSVLNGNVVETRLCSHTEKKHQLIIANAWS